MSNENNFEKISSNEAKNSDKSQGEKQQQLFLPEDFLEAPISSDVRSDKVLELDAKAAAEQLLANLSEITPANTPMNQARYQQQLEKQCDTVYDSLTPAQKVNLMKALYRKK